VARVVCEVRPGLASFVRFAIVTGADGRRESLQVDADFLTHENGTALLPVGVVYQEKDRALIEFPTMADSGAERLWVSTSALR
jgi:hypothetical protein